jgi:hypothetical protein
VIPWKRSPTRVIHSPRVPLLSVIPETSRGTDRRPAEVPGSNLSRSHGLMLTLWESPQGRFSPTKSPTKWGQHLRPDETDET